MAESETSRVGIEHIGLTVPSIPEATAWLEAVFGAEVMFDLVPAEGEGDPEDRTQALAAFDEMDREAVLGVPSAARIRAMRMLALGDGPVIELFEYEFEGQRPPLAPCDLGLQHFCVYVDDIDAARRRVVENGGTALDGPRDMPGLESGPGNRFMYTRAPWGTTIELITYPSRMPAEDLTSARRPGRRHHADG